MARGLVSLPVIVTVTMNAAIDRTLTVPNFQRGQRHRASQGLTLAGGKGINIARALKGFGVPVVATGLAGGRTGTRIVEELTSEAILNDFVRIDDESRTSTAIVDPTGSSYTEVNEWGPQVQPEELEMLLEKLATSRVAPTTSCSPARCRAPSTTASTPRPCASSTAAARRPCSTPRASRCGSARRPSRCSSPRTSARPRQLVGQEFHDDDDFLVGLETIAELGARNVLITRESGCWALLRSERETSRFRALAPLGSTRSRRSARATSCSPASSRRGSTAAPTRRRFGAPSRRERPRRSSSAPGASSPARPDGWWAAVEVAQLEPVGGEG